MLPHKTFGDFVDKKKRDAIHQLKLVEQILQKHGMKTENFLETDKGDTYIFCYNPQKNTDFDGIRIYKIGESIAFRIQKESKTHPYGQAYQIPIEEMFQDFLTDKGSKPDEAGKKVMDSVVKEIRLFFNKCVDAEKNNNDNDDRDDQGNVSMRSQTTDYSALVYNKG